MEVLDGRHRALACDELGILGKTQAYTGSDPVAFAVSLNLHRRHLSPSQLAFVGLEIERVESELAKGRMVAGGAVGGSSKGKEFVPYPIEDAGQARDKAAAAVGVNGKYITDAKRIEREAPELAEQVKAGAKTIQQAKREIKEGQRNARRELNRELIARTPTPMVAGGAVGGSSKGVQRIAHPIEGAGKAREKAAAAAKVQDDGAPALSRFRGGQRMSEKNPWSDDSYTAYILVETEIFLRIFSERTWW